MSQELLQFLVQVGVAIALGAVVLIVAFIVLKLIAAIKQRWPRSPGVDLILQALTPYVYQAILAGERAVIWGLDALEDHIAATDKKRVADSVYNLIPDAIVVGGVTLSSDAIKRLVTRDEWQNFIKTQYDAADAFLQRNEVYLRGQVEQLKKLSPAA
jgi:hypothetical protein